MGSQQSRKAKDGRVNDSKRARVVNLRTWKAQKRIKSMRGRTSWTRYILHQLSYVLVILAAGSAILSCVPSTLQAQSIIWTWFFGIIGMVVGLVLNVVNDRKWSSRFLVICLCSVTVSFVVGLVMTH